MEYVGNMWGNKKANQLINRRLALIIVNSSDNSSNFLNDLNDLRNLEDCNGL